MLIKFKRLLSVRGHDHSKLHDPRLTCQRCRAQKQGHCGARAGEAEGWHSQSVLRIWREVWGGEGPNGQGLQILLFETEHILCCTAWFVICISTVQVALGHNYVAQVEQHSSQKDASKGFGGKFGIQKDRVDKVRTYCLKNEHRGRLIGGSVSTINHTACHIICLKFTKGAHLTDS